MDVGSGYIIEVLFDSTEDFSVEFYVERERSQKFKKSELLKVETSEGVRRFARIDSRVLGRGNIMCRAEVYDREAHWGKERPVVMHGFTGLFIGSCLCGAGGGFDCHGYKFGFKCLNDIPKDVNSRIYYGVVRSWVTGYEYITEQMIKEDIEGGSISRVNVAPFAGKIDVNEGDRMVVLVPYEELMTAKKVVSLNESFAQKVPFGTEVMGANGEIVLELDGVKYRLYGEFMVVSGEINISVE